MTVNDLVFIDSTGYHVADFPAFLAFVQDGYRAIYGADVYLEADSQDGQFLAVLAKSLYDTAVLGAAVYNSFSPVSAQGTGLSRVVKINGLNRISATHSTVDLDLVGQAGTVITNGVAQDSLGQKWDIPSPTTIPGGGAITITATAQTIGAVAALPNTITLIFTPTLGWQTVNNPSAATLGVPVESDAELRARQAQSTANPSLTVLDGTIGAVANVPGVTNVRGYENDTGSTDGNGLPAHSISIVVSGGDSMAVAQAIQIHKTPGTQTYGTTDETVFDSHGMPLVIHFYRPTTATIGVEITIAVDDTYSSDYEDLIKDAVAAVINEIGIGNTVLITKLYAPAYLNNTAPSESYDVVLLQIKKNAGSYGTSNISINFNELPFCDPLTDVTVIVT